MRLSLCNQSVSLLALVALVLPPSCLAETGNSYVSQLDECERIVVGKVSASAPMGARLDGLERQLFGKTRSGSLTERLRAIRMTLEGSASSESEPSQTGAATAKQLEQTSTPASSAQDTDTDSSTERTKELLRQAMISHAQGDLAGAGRIFEQVLTSDKNNTDANYNLGAMAEERGNLDSAMEFYRKAAFSAPEDVDIRKALTAVERKLAKREEHGSTAQAADATKLKDLAKDAALAYKAGHYDAAISDLQLIADQEQGDASIQYGLARAWRGKGDFIRARQHLSSAVALAPEQQLYADALEDLDKQIQSKKMEGNGSGETYRGSELRDATGSAQDENKQTAAKGDDKPAGEVTPFTNQGAPQPLLGYAGAEVPATTAGVGGGGLGVAPVGLLVGSTFDRAVEGSIAGMAALGAISRGYCGGGYYGGGYYGGGYYPRYRIARGALGGGLLGLFRGY